MIQDNDFLQYAHLDRGSNYFSTRCYRSLSDLKSRKAFKIGFQAATGDSSFCLPLGYRSDKYTTVQMEAIMNLGFHFGRDYLNARHKIQGVTSQAQTD